MSHCLFIYLFISQVGTSLWTGFQVGVGWKEVGKRSELLENWGEGRPPYLRKSCVTTLCDHSAWWKHSWYSSCTKQLSPLYWFRSFFVWHNLLTKYLYIAWQKHSRCRKPFFHKSCVTALRDNIAWRKHSRPPSSIVHRPSSIVHRPSSIVHRPSSTIHRPASRF